VIRDLLIYDLPPWVLAIPGLAAAVFIFWFVHKRWGWKPALAAAGAVITASLLKLIYRKGQQQGRSETLERLEEETDNAVKTADEVRARMHRDNADPERLRDNDGWRRD